MFVDVTQPIRSRTARKSCCGESSKEVASEEKSRDPKKVIEAKNIRWKATKERERRRLSKVKVAMMRRRERSRSLNPTLHSPPSTLTLSPSSRQDQPSSSPRNKSSCGASSIWNSLSYNSTKQMKRNKFFHYRSSSKKRFIDSSLISKHSDVTSAISVTSDDGLISSMSKAITPDGISNLFSGKSLLSENAATEKASPTNKHTARKSIRAGKSVRAPQTSGVSSTVRDYLNAAENIEFQTNNMYTQEEDLDSSPPQESKPPSPQLFLPSILTRPDSSTDTFSQSPAPCAPVKKKATARKSISSRL